MSARRKPRVFEQGPEAARQFDATLSRVLRVSKAEVDKRDAEYQESRKHRSRPGPKPTKK